jgi:hypothetical protein
MISARAAAAEAARAAGRAQATFEVVGRALVRNGRTVKVGARIKLAQADADVFLATGRIKPAKGKGGAVEDEPDTLPSNPGDPAPE